MIRMLIFNKKRKPVLNPVYLLFIIYYLPVGEICIGLTQSYHPSLQKDFRPYQGRLRRGVINQRL